MTIFDAFGHTKKNNVMKDTWGHLYPKHGKYPCKIWVSDGGTGNSDGGKWTPFGYHGIDAKREQFEIRLPDALEKPKLLPCPFCGGNPEYVPIHYANSGEFHTSRVECPTCLVFKEVTIHSWVGNRPTESDIKPKVIKKWNTRVRVHYG